MNTFFESRYGSYQSLRHRLQRRPTVQELADEWMVPISTVTAYKALAKREHGVALETWSQRSTHIDHIADVCITYKEKYGDGVSFVTLGRFFGVSKQRIHQIFKELEDHGRKMPRKASQATVLRRLSMIEKELENE